MDDIRKNRISGPMDTMIPCVQIHGVPILIVADLPEGGFLQVVSGSNPLLPATPSVELAKGCMLAVVPQEVAEHLRPGLQAVEKVMAKGLAAAGG